MMRVAILLSGPILYALALPPFDLSLCAWLALVPLLLVVRGRPVLWAFGYGVLHGYLCSCTIGLSWIAPAVSRFFGVSLGPAAALASIYSLLSWGVAFGVFAAGAAILLGRTSLSLAVPALWVATELFRGRLLGQPWALLGYTQHSHLAIIQVAAVAGVYGVSFLIAFVSTTVAEAVYLLREQRRREAFAALSLSLALLAFVFGAGTLILVRGPTGGFAARQVAVVQTSIEPAREWTRSYTERQIMSHLQATAPLRGARDPLLVVWPENAVPRYLETEPLLAVQLASFASGRRVDLLFGAPRYEAGRTYNSVRLITAAGRDGGAYDKQRLVIGAEWNPFASQAESEPSENPHQFSPGSGPGVLGGTLPLGVSICHEILFPDLISRSVASGAALLVNVSNDGWLDGGQGIASAQHFAMAVFRAVENRRYLVRAATTGVSGVVDPYGRVVDVLAPGRTGTLRASVAGRTAVTPYTRFGDAFALACVLGAALALASGRTARVQSFARLASVPRTS